MIIFNFLRVCSVHAKMLYIRYFMWYINYLHLISSRRNPEKPLLCLCCDQGRVVAVVSVTRRVLTQQWCLDAGWPPAPAQPRICRPRFQPWRAAASMAGPLLHLNCQLSTRRIQTGAQHIFSMATTFHSLCPFLQKDLVLEFLVLSISCRQKVQNLPSTCRSCALHYFYILFQCHGHSIKNIFVFANFFVESTTCISWMCYE